MSKIKKYILVAGGAGILLLSAAFVYAHTSRLEELKEKAMMRSQQARERMEDLREQAKNRAQQARENAQKKISQIKDQKQKEAANRIASQFDRINQVWTDHFTNVLDRLDAILQKIKSRAEKAAANGQDVSLANTAIQKAGNAISTARTAVLNQAQKTYIVDTTNITSTESSQSNLVSQLRVQFKSLRDKLLGDLKSLRDGAMKDARRAVKDAWRALSQVPKVDEEPDTNSNNQ